MVEYFERGVEQEVGFWVFDEEGVGIGVVVVVFVEEGVVYFEWLIDEVLDERFFGFLFGVRVGWGR